MPMADLKVISQKGKPLMQGGINVEGVMPEARKMIVELGGHSAEASAAQLAGVGIS